MTTSLLAAALTAAVVLTPVAPAGADVPDPRGLSCSFFGWPVGIGEGGLVAGGPLSTAYDNGDATLRCSIQSGASTHAAADVASETAVNTYSVTLNPRFAEFDPSAGPLFLCTEWTGSDGVPRYFDTASLAWSADAASASCAEIVAADTSAANSASVVALACEVLPQVFTGSLATGLVTVAEDGDVTVAGTTVLSCPPGQEVPVTQHFYVAPPLPIG